MRRRCRSPSSRLCAALAALLRARLPGGPAYALATRGSLAVARQRQARCGQARDIIGEQREIGARDAIAGLLPGRVARVFQPRARKAAEASRSPAFGGRVQQLADKHIQVARRAQPAGQNLGAAAQFLQPFLPEFLAEGS